MVRASDLQGDCAIVISRNQQVVASRSVNDGNQLTPFALETGCYGVFVVSNAVCAQTVTISPEPLQLVEIHCTNAGH